MATAVIPTYMITRTPEGGLWVVFPSELADEVRPLYRVYRAWACLRAIPRRRCKKSDGSNEPGPVPTCWVLTLRTRHAVAVLAGKLGQLPNPKLAQLLGDALPIAGKLMLRCVQVGEHADLAIHAVDDKAVTAELDLLRLRSERHGSSPVRARSQERSRRFAIPSGSGPLCRRDSGAPIGGMARSEDLDFFVRRR